MRLINVKTLKLEEFLDYETPPYAILSHTWGSDHDELSFRDAETGIMDKSISGWVKLDGCCRQAQQAGLGYAWIDTCCIDKTNLVELSEAINSMFRWYKRASVCYAYLSDVTGDDDPRERKSAFRKSRWFRRGWTLQELLAPKLLQFYDSKWNCFGTKRHLCDIVTEITRVPSQFLWGITDLHNASVAQRMSWAAQRHTKRREDLAYCLLGIFGVTMPMIYGEGGDQAFLRLQEQILKTSRDDSILAWDLIVKAQPDVSSGLLIAGPVLAAAPSRFENSGHIVPREKAATSLNSLDIVGGSLRIHLSLTTSGGQTLGLLGCGPEDDAEQVVGIPLAQISPESSSEYVRPGGHYSILLPMTSATYNRLDLVYIRNGGRTKTSADVNRRYWLYDDYAFSKLGIELIDVYPRKNWQKDQALLISRLESDEDCEYPTLARFRHHVGHFFSADFVLAFEFAVRRNNFEEQCSVMKCQRTTGLEVLAEMFGCMKHRVSGNRDAGNGLVNLRVTWQPVARQPMFILRPEEMPNLSGESVDVTLELERLDLMLEFVRILEAKGLSVAEQEERWTDVQKRWDDFRRIYGGEDGYKLEKPRNWSPFQWAVENGYTEMSRLLLVKTGSVTVANDDSWTPLIAASRKGYADMVQQLLDSNKLQGSDLEVEDTVTGQTVLIWAAEKGHEAVTRQLLDEGVNLEAQDVSKQTALSKAAEKGHTAIVQLLLEGGADSEARDAAGRTPLSWAAEKGHTVIMQLLLERGADIEAPDAAKRTPLSWAAENGHASTTRLLLQKRANLEAKSHAGRTALSWAAGMGHMAVVQLLLEKGADLKARDREGQTPLSWAVRGGHQNIVRLLLKLHSDLEAAADNSGQRLLSLATENGHNAVAKLLLEEGADVEAKDKDGKTALYRAAAKGHTTLVAFLLENGSDLFTEDCRGRTLLPLVAEAGHISTVLLLLEKGVDLRGGQRALPLAAGNGHIDMVQLLLDKGADLEAKAFGQTALLLAAKNGHEAVVRLLLKKGAHRETGDFQGRTPLIRAVAEGREAIAQLLLEKVDTLEEKWHRTIDWKSRTAQALPLQQTSENTCSTVTPLQLSRGANLETKDCFGRTALWWAVKRVHSNVVQLLLNNGADTEAKTNKDNKAILSSAISRDFWDPMRRYWTRDDDLEVWARKRRYETCIQLLLANDAHLEARDSSGSTALFHAVQDHWAGEISVRLLIESGARADTEDNDGRTALSMATDWAVRQMLILHGA
ncbi:unnamed protein product [Clonostachys solani]|uniref:Heterokaryon incompatibility domain-containing protein n=1 Tax=Clonostachys solani TaxID=160281 RepID=A0A9N9YYN6_9HYPO|nr:unnamed protein product [Clonostachys solani]